MVRLQQPARSGREPCPDENGQKRKWRTASARAARAALEISSRWSSCGVTNPTIPVAYILGKQGTPSNLMVTYHKGNWKAMEWWLISGWWSTIWNDCYSTNQLHQLCEVTLPSIHWWSNQSSTSTHQPTPPPLWTSRKIAGDSPCQNRGISTARSTVNQAVGWWNHPQVNPGMSNFRPPLRCDHLFFGSPTGAPPRGGTTNSHATGVPQLLDIASSDIVL